MRKIYCNQIEKLFKELYVGMFYVANFNKRGADGGYLWVFRENDNGRMIMVIHGDGDEPNPFEIKLIQVDENKTVCKQFDSIEDLIGYVRDSLLDDLMVYEI